LPDQARLLRGEACDELQGYLFGRPMPPGEIPAWIAANGRGGQGAHLFDASAEASGLAA